MTKIIRTADVVKIADFTFRHVCTNKISLKVGSNLSFNDKISLGTLKLTHLLYKKQNFINRTFSAKNGKIQKNPLFIQFLALLWLLSKKVTKECCQKLNFAY